MTNRNLLFLVLFLVFLTRISVLIYVYPDTDRLYITDSFLYVEHAVSMMETGEYLAPRFGSTDRNPYADMIRPPGFPVTLYFFYSLFGETWAPWIHALAGVMLNSVLVLVLWQFFRLLSMQRYGFVLLLFALDPAWSLYSKELITEPWFTPLMLVAVLFGIVAFAKVSGLERTLPGLPQMKWLSERSPLLLMSLSGALLGVATSYKPITFYAPWAGVLGFAIGWVIFRKFWSAANDSSEGASIRTPRYVIGCLALFLVASQIFIFGWQLRNYSKHGTLSYTSIQAEILMTGHAAFVLADAKRIPFLEARQVVIERHRAAHPEHAGYDFDGQTAAYTQVAREIFKEYPFNYVRVVVRGMVATLLDPGRLVFNRTFGDQDLEQIGLLNTISSEGLWGTFKRLLREYPGFAIYMVLYATALGIVALLALAGLWHFLRYHPVAGLFILGAFLYLLVLGGPYGYARFRLYVMPWMLLMMPFAFKYALPMTKARLTNLFSRSAERT